MTQPAGHVELVIRTASSLLVGRIAAREAVTILATQTPRALARAADLARRDPDRAGSYAVIVRSLNSALASDLAGHPDARDVAAVRKDLDDVARALDPG